MRPGLPASRFSDSDAMRSRSEAMRASNPDASLSSFIIACRQAYATMYSLHPFADSAAGIVDPSTVSPVTVGMYQSRIVCPAIGTGELTKPKLLRSWKTNGLSVTQSDDACT